jgi:glycosyltransferase involved in cell wall biosynthesis
MMRLMKGVIRRLSRYRSRSRNKTQRCASLKTTVEPVKGNVLIAYVLDPFLRKEGEPLSCSHTHHYESLLIARALLDLGYNVDVIDYNNRHYLPVKRYAFLISARTYLEEISSRLNPDCTIIAHLDTSHYIVNNLAVYSRVLALRERRGIACPSIRLIEHNRAIEFSDYGIVLGNEVTMNTYRYAGARLFPINVPSPLVFPFPDKNYGECRNHYLWFGSSGFVHKGLDLVLEAFCKMPDLHLHICGPVQDDPEFCDAFRSELFHTPNIHTIGWIDVSTPEFQEIARKVVALVYPSCAEGQAGSVVLCLHAGIIPMVSRESGLDIEDFGVMLNDCAVDEITERVRKLSTLDDDVLEQMTKGAWNHARGMHVGDKYAAGYRSIITEIMDDIAKDAAGVQSSPKVVCVREQTKLHV